MYFLNFRLEGTLDIISCPPTPTALFENWDTEEVTDLAKVVKQEVELGFLTLSEVYFPHIWDLVLYLSYS